MFKGKTNAALDLLHSKGKSKILHANDPASADNPTPTVLDVLKSKHPASQPLAEAALISTHLDPPTVHPVIFDKIDANSIRSASLSTKGAAGPSGLDAHCWRRLCTSFQTASQDLCHSISLFARRLATSLVDPMGLSSYLARRLIALDKCPGVRPIGICDTVRRIVSKAILHITKTDVQEAIGARQLCAGQTAGIEAAVHSVRESFNLNRKLALYNVQHTCPSLAKVLINTYRNPSDLFVDGITLLSDEGTTQGDPSMCPGHYTSDPPFGHSRRSEASMVRR